MKTLIQFTQNRLGSGDDVLGEKILFNYVKQRLNENRLPAMMCFFNSGVKLLTSDSEITDLFIEIEKRGVKLIACKTCLDYFGLTDKVRAGVVASMIDIITLQDNADKIINI